MAHGTVKWFSPDQGYGFIEVDDGGHDIFVHFTAIQTDGYRVLEEGQRVEFEIMKDDRGSHAEAVRATDAMHNPISPSADRYLPFGYVAHFQAMWEPAICALVAADYGDARASAALNSYFSSWEDSTDWAALANVLARIKAGDRYDPNLLTGLDGVDTLIATRALDALAGKVPVSPVLGPAIKFGTMLCDLVFAVAHDDPTQAELARGNLKIAATNGHPMLAAALTRILAGDRNPDLASELDDPFERDVVKTVLHYIPLAEAEDPRNRWR